MESHLKCEEQEYAMKDMLIIFAKIAVGMLIAGIIIAFGAKIEAKSKSSLDALDKWDTQINSPTKTAIVMQYDELTA